MVPPSGENGCWPMGAARSRCALNACENQGFLPLLSLSTGTYSKKPSVLETISSLGFKEAESNRVSRQSSRLFLFFVEDLTGTCSCADVTGIATEPGIANLGIFGGYRKR